MFLGLDKVVAGTAVVDKVAVDKVVVVVVVVGKTCALHKINFLNDTTVNRLGYTLLIVFTKQTFHK